MTDGAAVSLPSQTTTGSMLLSKHRVEALADGLFAIVMTLLVLELKVPELPKHSTDAAIWQELMPLGRVLFSFVLTFFLAGMFWLTQQSVLTATRILDRAGVGLHLAAMMFVSLLPFSTAMLGRYINTRLATGIYFANQFCIAALLCAAWWRERHLGNLGDIPRETEQRITLRVSSMTGVMLGACVAGSIDPHYAFLGALPALLVVRIYRRKLKLG